MHPKDHYCGIVLILFGGWLIWEASSFPALAGMPYGAGLFPTIAALGMCICGFLILITALIKRRSAQPLEEEASTQKKEYRPLINTIAVITAVIIYALLLNIVGFHILSFFMLAVLFLVLQVRWFTTLLLASGVTVGVHFIFYSMLHVPLPWGLMEPIAW